MTLYQLCLNCSARMNKVAARAKNRKTFKRLLLLNQWMDCNRQFFLKKLKRKSTTDPICLKCSSRDPLLNSFNYTTCPPPPPPPHHHCGNCMICIENFDNLTNHLPDLNQINTTILNLKQWDKMSNLGPSWLSCFSYHCHNKRTKP